MENYTWEWIVNNWTIVAGGLLSALVALKSIVSAVKSVTDPIVASVTNHFAKKEDAEKVVQTETKNQINLRDIDDKVVLWKTRLSVLEGDELQLAKDRIIELQDERQNYV